MEKEFKLSEENPSNTWLELVILPCFKDLKELAERVTAKKAYQDYLNELREKLDKHIKEINRKLAGPELT